MKQKRSEWNRAIKKAMRIIDKSIGIFVSPGKYKYFNFSKQPNELLEEIKSLLRK